MSAFSRERSPDLTRRAESLFTGLRERLRRRDASLVERGPEDPSWVILEVFAEALAELQGDLDRLEERLLPRVLEALGEEPHWGTPARAAVRLVCAQPASEPVLVPRGTVLVAPRREGEPRIAFETSDDAWTSGAQLERVTARAGAAAQELLPHPQGGWDAEPVTLFGGRTAPVRHLYLGDEVLSRLTRADARLVLEWPSVPQVLWDGSWECSVAGGWRAVQVGLEETRGPGVKRGARLVLEGPLPDLAAATIEGATLPWLRLALPGDRKTSFLPPRWAALESQARPEDAPRQVARILSHGGERWEDHSLTSQKIAPVEASDDWDPAIALGWDRATAGSVYWALEGASVPASWSAIDPARAPRLEWEYSTGRGFRALAVRDGTAALTRSGCWSWDLPREWTAQEHLGEKLFWLRARWLGGEHARASRVRAVIPHAAAAVERTRRRDVLLELPVDKRGRALFELEDAELESLEAIELPADAGGWTRLEVSGAGGPAERRGPPSFTVRRLPRGGFSLEGPFRPSVPATVRIPTLLLHHGARGNVAAGTSCVLERELAGLAKGHAVIDAEAGVDPESPEAFRHRLVAEWKTGERAVTAADYRRLAMALEPDIGRAEVHVRPGQPWRLAVSVLPRQAPRPGSFSPARLRWLEERLQEMAPLGTVVEVIEPAYVPLHVVARLPSSESAPGEAQRRRLEQRLRESFDPLRGGRDGLGMPMGRWPAEEEVLAALHPARTGAPGARDIPLGAAEDGTMFHWRFEVRRGDLGLVPWLLPVMERLTLECPGS